MLPSDRGAYTPALLPEYREQIIPYRAVSCRITTPSPAPPIVNTTLRVGSGEDRSRTSICLEIEASMFQSHGEHVVDQFVRP
jgi:hypothetical protein